MRLIIYYVIHICLSDEKEVFVLQWNWIHLQVGMLLLSLEDDL